ncbi:MAG: hypothetical protein IRZ02_10020 [Acidothermus sp.]|nr:hypothetical protein [Acidothermus sp.]MCL6537913.1 hypothetical protein [Acidothermus sp.]
MTDSSPVSPSSRGNRTWPGITAAVVLGCVAGLLTTTQATRWVDGVPIGGVVAFAANAGLGAFVGWGLRARQAAALPGLGWLIVLLALLALPTPGGDVLVPGSGTDVTTFLVGGLAGVPAAVFLARRLLRSSAPSVPGGDPRRTVGEAGPSAENDADVPERRG